MKVKKGYKDDGSFTLVGTYADGRGQKGFRRDTFSKTETNRDYYETNSLFGH